MRASLLIRPLSVGLTMAATLALVGCTTGDEGQAGDLEQEEPVTDEDGKADISGHAVEPAAGWTSHVDRDAVTDVTVGPEGAVWTAGAGVRRWQPDGSVDVELRSEHGLGSNDVRSVEVAGDGSVWAATGRGLSVFDGEAWTTYTADDGLLDNDVRAVATGDDGTVWTATRRGLSTFEADATGDRWYSYDILHDLDLSPTSHDITSVAVAEQGGVWAGTRAGAVVEFDGTEWTIHAEADGLTSFEISSVAVTDGGTVWAGDGTFGDAVWAFDGDEWVPHTPEDLRGHHTLVRSVSVAGDGTVWAGTAKGTLAFDGAEWTTHDLDLSGDGSIPAVATGADGTVWAGSPDGLWAFHDQEWTIHAAGGLASNHITSVALAGDDEIWAAGERGVSTLADGDRAAYSLDELPELRAVDREEEGSTTRMRRNHLSSVAVADDGTVWVASNQGVSRFADGAWTTDTAADGLHSGQPQDFDEHWPGVTSVAVADDGTVWAGGALEDGLWVFDGQQWQTKTREGVAPDGVNAVATAQNTVWVATDEGVAGFDDADWTIHPGEGLPGRRVLSVSVADDGTVWAATDDGVTAYDGGQWTAAPTEGLPTTHINAVAPADDDTLWAATPKGLARFDGEEWITYTAADGLAADHVNAVTVADDGTVWAATNAGVAAFDPTAQR